ncbi:MAG: DUF2062 domain-containing protein [Victivallaceae bacterium]|nr:DUF2062 domain-containing protein [Victivallaceae bacterium]
MPYNFKRNFRKLYYAIVRADGTPEYIARGWGLGMFIGCVIPMSVQLMISIPLSFALRCSKIGATLGTFITNPITVIFIYPAQCWVGNKLIGGHLTYDGTAEAIRELMGGSISALANLGWDLIASFFIGGFLLAAITTPITYFVVYALVTRYQRFREKRRQAKLSRRA